MTELVVNFDELSGDDTGRVGGKCANLGELANAVDVPVLPGFATTAGAYKRFLEETGIEEQLSSILAGLDPDSVRDLQDRGERVRGLIRSVEFPGELKEAFTGAYRELCDRVGTEDCEVAVRSSATAEDLPGASFAGQQESFLNVSGAEQLLERIRDCYASLFTNRAISYRENKGFEHMQVQLSVAVQKMGRSDTGVSGVLFTIDPDSGFENALVIDAGYGLGDYIVQGEINPDRYYVFKTTGAVLDKQLGDKEVKLVRGESGEHRRVEVSEEDRERYCLSDEQIEELGEYGVRIEEHYDMPMDVEWLLDGETEELYIVQARPETVHSERDPSVIEVHRLEEQSEVLLEGTAIGTRIGAGEAHVLHSPKQIDEFEEGEVLVTDRTDPDWGPIMKQAGAIVTNKGGATSHAAIVSRELGIPAVVGAGGATATLRDGDPLTVDCSSSPGRIWRGELDFRVDRHHVDEIPDTATEVQVNLGAPGMAFHAGRLPVDGVGLAREEFIIAEEIGVHPLALIERGEEEQFVEKLRFGIGRIGAAFHPRPVIVRLSDFKSDEYAQLEGGEDYEPGESNPMLGWRGASRFYHEDFVPAFELECRALRRCIDYVGLDNLVVMVPFCRTPEEGEKVREKLREYGLDRGDIEVYVMAELPANIIRVGEFAEVFDGFSIGTNDLTQFTLGVDRNSDRLRELFDERDPAVKRSVEEVIDRAHEHGLHVGICGDAPSTHEGYAEFLVRAGIDAISVSPDVAMETILRVAATERELEGDG